MPDAALDLAALDALAEKATPGPYFAHETWSGMQGDDALHRVATCDGRLVVECEGDNREANAAYIAAVSPEVVRRLIQVIRDYRGIAHMEHAGVVDTNEGGTK